MTRILGVLLLVVVRLIVGLFESRILADFSGYLSESRIFADYADDADFKSVSVGSCAIDCSSFCIADYCGFRGLANTSCWWRICILV